MPQALLGTDLSDDNEELNIQRRLDRLQGLEQDDDEIKDEDDQKDEEEKFLDHEEARGTSPYCFLTDRQAAHLDKGAANGAVDPQDL